MGASLTLRPDSHTNPHICDISIKDCKATCNGAAQRDERLYYRGKLSYNINILH